MSTPNPNCKHCQKSSLSLLLLRPSPIATLSALQPPGASGAVADGALVNPLIPAGLTESRPVLRLLRAGYVHLYIPKTNKWQVYSVTDRGELLAQHHPNFGDAKMPSCRRDGHSAAGFKLLSIPDAHELIGQSIWLAFSANLWSATLKNRNKANPQAMVEVKLGSAAAPAFKPTAQAIGRQLLEAKVSQWRLPKLANVGPMFPFNTMAYAGQVEQLAKTLEDAAAGHPKTKGHELAVVLPDPVGYAAELNALRLTAEAHHTLLSDADRHKLHSHFTLKGLTENVASLRALNNVAPIVTRGSFEALQKTSPTRMQGATFEPMQQPARPGPQEVGRMWTPQARATFEKQAPKFQELAKKEIESGYNPSASEAWFKDLTDKTLQAIQPFERQWLLARDHGLVGRYFAQHFDSTDINRPGSARDHSPGAAYVSEAALVEGPPPKTSVALLDTYMAAYYKKPAEPEAFLLRAMVANQQELFEPLATQLAGDPNGDGMRDKTVDFIKGLLEVNNGHLKVKYGWLADATMTLAMGPMNHLAAAMGTYVALAGTDTLKTRPRVAALAANAAAWVGGMDTALKSALTRQVIRPVIVQAWVDSDLVDGSVQGVGKQRKSAKHQRGGKTRVTLLTDSERLAKQPSVAQLLAESGGSQLAFGKAAGTAMVAGAGSGTIVLRATDARSGHASNLLFAQQVQDAKNIAGSVRAAVPTGVKAATLSIDGRLALASVIVQSIGIINGQQAVATAEKALAEATDADRAEQEKKLRDAQLGYMDSVGGLVAGGLDTLRVAGEAMNLQRGAAAGGVALGSIHALKFGAQVAGVFGGFLNGYVSYLKAKDAKDKGLDGSMFTHFVGSVSFFGTGISAVAVGGLAVAEFIVDRQIGSAALQATAKGLAEKKVGELLGGRAATFVGQRAAGVTLAVAIPVAGWVLLGAGIVASVVAALMEPTKLEQWARQTPFGKGPVGAKFKTVDEQDKALNEALGLAQTSAPEAQAA